MERKSRKEIQMKNETCLIKKAEGENLMIREEKDKCSGMEEMKRNGRDYLQKTQAERQEEH